MNRHPRLALLAAAAALIASGAHAATQQQLDGTPLYGNVSIGQDSVDKWGPWEQFEPPQAGRPNAGPGNFAHRREAYRPLPRVNGPIKTNPEQPPEVVLACAAGSICGYALKVPPMIPSTEPEPTVLTAGSAFESAQAEAPSTDPEAISLHLVTVTPVGEPLEGPLTSSAITLKLQNVESGEVQDVPRLDLTGADRALIYSSEDGEFAALIPYLDEDTNGLEEINFHLQRYLDGGEAFGYAFTGAVGRVSTTEEMAVAAGQNPVASYTGFDMDHGGTQGSVKIDVNFKSGALTYNTSGGVQTYEATGKVIGSGYQATTFTTPNTSGKVQGSFIGFNGKQPVGTIGGAVVTQDGVTQRTVHTTELEVPRVD